MAGLEEPQHSSLRSTDRHQYRKPFAGRFIQSAVSAVTSAVSGSPTLDDWVEQETFDDLKNRPRSYSSSVGPQSIDLVFEDISFSVGKQTFLHPISGAFQGGEFVAIMGPSGCGKTTILDILAAQKTMPYEGSIYINGEERNDKLFCRMASYVAQEDVFEGLFTVRETLMLTAQLLSPSGTPLHEIKTTVDSVIDELGLTKVADSQIGTPMKRGISGGQKRRVSIAQGLVSRPSMIFLDEPTSGLSATDSEIVVEMLSEICRSQRCVVVCVIHQPRTSIFDSFDKLLLLSEGRAVYQGPADAAVDYFEDLGHPIPPRENPADFFLDLITPGARKCVVEELWNEYDEAANEEEAEMVKEMGMKEGPSMKEILESKGRSSSRYAHSYWSQIKVFLPYGWTLAVRDSEAFYNSLGNWLLMGLLLGLMYYQSDDTLARISCIYVALLTSAINSMEVLPVFINDRVLFQSAHASGESSPFAWFFLTSMYYTLVSTFYIAPFSAIVYYLAGLRGDSDAFAFFLLCLFVAYFTLESLIMLISNASKTFETANSNGSFVVGALSLFSGLTANKNFLPAGLEWALYVSPFWYGFEALTLNELGTRADAQEFQTLFALEEDFNHKWIDLVIILGMGIVYRGAALWALAYMNKRKK